MLDVALVLVAVGLLIAVAIVLVVRLAAAAARRSAAHFAHRLVESRAGCVDCSVALGPPLQACLQARPDHSVWSVVCPSCGSGLFFTADLADVTREERTLHARLVDALSHRKKATTRFDRWPRLTIIGLAILTFLAVASLTWLCWSRP